MTLSFEPGERFKQAADEWADQRILTDEQAYETKVEQALHEIEHLVSGHTDVAFELDGDAVEYDPSGELAAFLGEQAELTGLDEATLLRLHVDLFARAFLQDDQVTS